MILVYAALIAQAMAPSPTTETANIVSLLRSDHFLDTDFAAVVNTPRSTTILCRLIADPRSKQNVVARALYVLQELSPPPREAIYSARLRLTSSHGATRWYAVRYLSAVGDTDSLAPITVLLADPNLTTRYASLRHLAAHGDEGGLIGLEVWLKGPSWEVYGTEYRDEARTRLKAARDRLPYPKAPSGVGVLRSALADPDPAVRLDAVKNLSATTRPGALAPLAALLSDEDARVRRAAADALAASDDLTALIALDCWLLGPAWEWVREDVRPHVRAARDRLARRLAELQPVQTAPPPRPVGP
jgi:HEAT repeat protein